MMSAILTKSRIQKGLALIGNRIRWLYKPPAVRGTVPKMHPGVLRMDQEEEDAVAEAARDVIRSKRLFRYFGASPNPLQKSRVDEF